MMFWSFCPVWLIDLIGSIGMIIVSFMCLRTAQQIFRRAPENALANYLLWFCFAIFAFSASRSLGHIIKHILYFAGHSEWWARLAPISGSINSITFVVIASVTLYFRRTEAIMTRMAHDRDKISKTGQELLELNREIESIVSERTQTEMALHIAHEIRNPAVIIGGLVRRLTKNIPDNAPEKERLEKVVEQAEKLESIVAKFDDIRPERRKKFSLQELNGLLEEAIDTIQQEAEEKGITMVLDRVPALLNFQGNKHLIKSAIIHVLRNALEICGPGDAVQITTELGEKGIVARIEDNGPGIPEAILDHVLDPFFSTEKGEAGIGLSYVRQIIEEHKGSVEIVSKEGLGTSVEIRLPPLLGELSRTKEDGQQ